MNRSPDSGVGEAVAARGLTGTVVRGTALAGIGFALSQTLTLASYLVLARLVSPTEFGYFTAGLVLVAVAEIYTASGMQSALIYRRDRVDEAAATAVIATVLGSLVVALVMLALAPAIGWFFDNGTVTGVAAAASGLVLLRATSIVPDALLQRRFSFIRRLVIEPAAVLAFGITGVVLTANGLGVWGLVLAQYAAVLVKVLLSWGLARWRPQLRLATYSMWRELISYGRHTIAATTVIRVGEEIPVLLLGRFAGAVSLGQFRYGRRIATLPLAMVMAAGSYVLFPAFARIATERARFHASVLRALRWMAILSLAGGLILIPLGEPLTTLAFGPVWSEAGKAVMALGFFAAARGVTCLAVETLKAHGRPDVVTRMNVVEVVVGSAAMLALLPLGLVGVCIGISIGAAIRAAYAFRQAHHVVGLPLTSMLEAIRAPLLAGLVMVATLLPLEAFVFQAGDRATAAGLLLLALEAALGLAIYAGILQMVMPGALAELRGLLKRLRTRSGPEAAVRSAGVGLGDLVTARRGPGRATPRTGES
jgi:O-antigen/teichoic acid export membrane protein